MTPRWMRMRAVMTLELQVQRREPLTFLYMLVFLLLAMAFAASGPVELVRGRGAVPRDAAWSLMLASTAITAFGQVITTMVAATVVLRDRADRVADLLVATRLTESEYRVAKLLAALVMLLVIYAAIPVGLVAGAVLGGGSVFSALRGSVPPFALIVVPTMCAVGALQFAVGVLSGRLWVIVAQGLVLIWLWTAAIGAATSTHAVLPALLDPFGSAALLVETASWTDGERMQRAMPVTTMVIAGRLLWLMLAAGAATVAILHRPSRRVARTDAPRVDGALTTGDVGAAHSVARAGHARWRIGALATAQYVVRWMLRDAGWRVLTLLGALNVGVHAAVDLPVDGDAPALLAVLQEHARLFLILLATIYAGELVWREREERSAALFDSLPVSRSARIVGRVAGVVLAQCAVVLALTVAAVLGAVLGTAGSATDSIAVVTLVPGRVLLPFVAWLLVSLAVHVLVQQKVVAHLLCIAGWAVASVSFGAVSATADTRVGAWGWWAVCLFAGSVVFLSWGRVGGWRQVRQRSQPSAALS